jgi:dCMP deaminase
MNWTYRFLELAEHIATWSKDPSTKVGAVVVDKDRHIICTGFNGFPRGVRDDNRLDDRDVKYLHICHAEENAIAQAARVGARLVGCRMYTSLFPCSRCARLIVQAGIKKVVCRAAVYPTRWAADFEVSRGILDEGNVKVLEVGA